MSHEEIAKEISALVTKKQAAYGDSFGKSGQILRILYPEGIKPEQLEDALVVVRIVDKLFRIATSRDALGESPWDDINGYSLLAATRVRQQKEPQPSPTQPPTIPSEIARAVGFYGWKQCSKCKGWTSQENEKCWFCGPTSWFAE